MVHAPFFSVIVPVYNKGPCIARCLSSVFSQCFNDFELIVVCDPCSDDSVIEVEKFKEQRLRVFHRDKPGAGGYAARNLGIKEAKAEWVAFLDADDEWLDNHLETAYELIKQHKSGLVASGWTDSWAGGRQELTPFCAYRQQNKIEELSFADYMLEAIDGRSAIHTNIITVNKSLMNSVGGFPEGMCRRGGDIATWLALLDRARGVTCIAYSTAVYHREDAGVTVDIAPEVEGNCVYLRCKSLTQNQKNKELTGLIKQFSNLHITFGLVRRASSGKLSLSDTSYHYGSESPFKHFIFFVLALLPAIMQRFCWRLYRLAK